MNHERIARIALLSFAVFSACKGEEPPSEGELSVQVRCVHPSRVSLDETVSLRGRIEPPPGGDLPVASVVSGRIVSLAAKEGDHVKSGDVVAVVDDAGSRAALREAEAAVAQAKATLVNANVTLERTKALVAKGIAPKQELDDATARADAAKSALDSAVAAADYARRTLGRVQVRTSFAGVVTHVFRGPGAIVDGTASTPIVQLATSDDVEFVADATQSELTNIAVGQPATGTFAEQADAGAFTGAVRTRASAIDPATGIGTVRIALHPSTRAVLGAYGRMTITTGHRDAVLVVPSAAIRGSISDGIEIVTCENGVAHVKTVQVGHRDDERTEVASGLGDQELVAIDHVIGLSDGTRLEPPKGKENKEPGK